ncbi:MAG: ligand-gated channel [SAR86 cluster bacterium]|uniref:Ligand-gated channel n=1 Tax=SAR86 cluster bacterium TaxID=2030880 RepID=A0A2A5B0P6_9GAMM|nr:MAG: ligand-gated channel [SAR86 cluster bacterium]
MSTTASAQDVVEEIVVLGRQEFLKTEFTAKRTGANVDAAKLMNLVPGGAAANNGPLTGQIQYRGMSGPRINVRVDGMLIHGGGPNWMAPPLHHIPAGLMEELVVEQGIPSISTGGGIGGAATAYWKRPDYNYGNGWKFSGDTEASFGSVDDGTSLSGVFGLSSSNQRIYAVGSFDGGDDYESAKGTVDATEYGRNVYGLGYGYKSGMNEFEFNVHRIETEDTGTASLPMDIDWFETEVWNASYKTEIGNVGLEVRIYGSDIDHGMSNSLLRPAPDFSSLMLPPFLGDDKRAVYATSEETGFKVSLDWAVGDGGTIIAGIEGKDAKHDADVSDPDFAPFFVNNFNDTDVEMLSVFGQWSSLIGQSWYLEAGFRSEKVDMSTGTVDAFPARLVDMNPTMWPMGTPPRAVWMLRQGFNASDRSQSDSNLDWVTKARYQATDNLVIELGFAQKTRSPLYQERYLWIPLEANAGLGDGNNYVGNPNLKPEESRQIELGFDWDFGDFYFSPRFFRRFVDDYIQGVPTTNMAVIGVSANANGDPTPLTFANTDAKFNGVDLTIGTKINDNWRLEGIASMINADRDDISDSLYRISPTNARISLFYETNSFSAKIEQVFMSEQDDLSRTNTFDPTNGNNSFVKTDSYNLTNVFLSWVINDKLTISTGAENLFDVDYIDHLTGFNRVIGSVVPVGSRMFGPGRNFFGRLQYQW